MEVKHLKIVEITQQPQSEPYATAFTIREVAYVTDNDDYIHYIPPFAKILVDPNEGIAFYNNRHIRIEASDYEVLH